MAKRYNHSATVSVVVPVFQAEDTIRRCIESVLSQRNVAWELLLINDGSTDSSAAIATEYLQRYSGIRLISQENLGRSCARNRGIANASGEWVAFLDADDYLPPLALASLLDDADSSDLIWGGYADPKKTYGIFGEGKTIEPLEALSAITDPAKCRKTLPYDITGGVLPRSVGGKLYRKHVLLSNEIAFPQGLRFGEDALFNLKALCRSNRLRITGKVAYYYDTLNSQTCKRFSNEDIAQLLRFAEAVRECVLWCGCEHLSNEDGKALIAQELVEAVSRAARYSSCSDEIVKMFRTALGTEELATCLDSFRPNTWKRSLVWRIERSLLVKGNFSAAFAIEKLR